MNSNIERMFAVWQAVHAEDDTRWFANLEDANKGLVPFLKRPKSDLKNPPDGDFWSSEDCKTTRKLGCYFREASDAIKDLPGSEVARAYKERYTGAISDLLSKIGRQPPKEMYPIDVAKKHFFQRLPKEIAPTVDTESSYMDLTPTIGVDEAVEIRLHQLTISMKDASEVEDREIWDWYIDDRIER